MNQSYHCWAHRAFSVKLFLVLGLLLSAPRFSQAQQQLVWEENFNGPTINPSTWAYDLGDGCAQGVCGWGNSELEAYTNRPENVRLENGNLVIEARRENYQNKPFTSARLKTLGRVQFKYGTLEARIKVPNLEKGLWPAFWMLGATGTWPASGEIDIMEMGSAAAIAAGLTNRRVGGATHWENAGSHASYDTKYDSPTDLTADYHVYKMSWDSQFIRMYIDGTEYYAIDISKGAAADLEEFHQAQFILLNLAVGGQYTGQYGPADVTAALPAQMLVDYVRLYQSPGDELYLGSNNAIAGEYGIYTEKPSITNKLAYGSEANLYLWNNLATIPSAVPYEGNEVLAVRAAAGAWFGFGVDNQVKNLAAFANGSLKFHFKTTYMGQFKVGLKSGGGESWVDFPADAARYGLARDGEWHEVIIPMSAFNNGDLKSVTATFMFAGDAASSTTDFYFDNIYYSGGVAANPAPTVSLTSPTAEALITTPADITLTANAADANGTVTKVDFYSGVTLLGTATTAPYSFVWANVPAGTYALTAKATDNEGVVTTSAAVTVFVAAPNNAGPAVSLTSPTATGSYTTPATITLQADATDADGSVYKVEFYNGSTLLGTDFTAPYSYTWTGVAASTYALTAKVTDNGKLTTTSATVALTVKDNTIAGPNFGVYTENAQVATKLVFGQDANLFLWNNLAIIAAAAPFEGNEVLALRASAGNWFGFGIDNDLKNLAAFANGSLKFHFKTAYAGHFKFGVKSANGESWVEFPAGATQYGLVRDGQWHEVAIPLKAFANLDLATLDQAFMFAGDAASTTADFYFDNIYYDAQPVVLPPVTYCGTAASGDYSYAATTVGSAVTVTFHPLGRVVGGNLAILYVNGGGYTMTKNAAGDFTYTLPNQTSGAVLNIYFTYALAAGGEQNSAAAPHTYTVGTPCTNAPANQAPTVSLTSPGAGTSLAAPASITLTADAADTDGTVAKVEFFSGTTLLGTDTAAPYSFTWSAVPAGSYSLTAKATDNANLTTTSAAVAVTVTGGTTPPVDPGGYCGTAASGDYSWRAVTTGTEVAFTFHPLGNVAGGNLAILYVNGGGYTMAKNTAGDFTYTVANQASGTVLSVYFTYQAGAGGLERNTAATPHSYTVGTTCGAPANVAPTVNLSSPTAAATFDAPASITLTANAADADGSVSTVEFYQGTTLLATVSAAPYTYTWTGVAAGIYALTAKATDNGGLSTTSAAVSVTVQTPPALISVLHQDADRKPGNNTLKPNLQLRNESNAAIPYKELTVRYWLTAEDYAPMQAVVDWAQVGTTNVQVRYVALAAPRQGALGYLEYSFTANAGSLAAKALSGPIQSRANKQNWTNFNEADDYSFAASGAYVQNERITVYRRGTLVGGVEPALTSASARLKVYAQNQSSTPSANTINTTIELRNEGNAPVAYRDLSVRYWLSPESTAPLAYSVDYALLGSRNVQLSTGKAGTETYAELRFAPALGELSPLSSTGSVQYRINKTDWSAFNQANDHSYQPQASALAENTRMTVYLDGQLVYGQEPAGARAAGRPGTAPSALLALRGYPNPVTDQATLEFALAPGQAYELAVYDHSGRLVQQLPAGTATGELTQVRWPAAGLARGLYLVRLRAGQSVQQLKLVLR